MLSLGYSFRARGTFRKVLVFFGSSSVVRGLTNLHLTDLIGWIANPTVQLKRTLNVPVPIEDAFEYLSNFSNYSRFMSFVTRVEVNQKGGLRWTLRAPAGVPIQWDTSLAKLVRNQTIAWKSSLSSLVRNSGEIHLKELATGATQIDIQLNYAPPVGALGYAVAHFLGFDPKDKIDADLATLRDQLTLKSLRNL